MKNKFSIPLWEDMSINEFLNYFHVSSGKINELFSKKEITVNGKYIPYDQKIRKNSFINFEVDSPEYMEVKQKLDIVYEDKFFLIINKKRDTIIHGEEKALINIVSTYINTFAYYPHRLDKDTTGLIIFCKNFLIASYFDYQFREKKIEKRYLARVHGSFTSQHGIIDQPIGNDRHNNGKMAITKNGKRSITEYFVLKNSDTPLVEVYLCTGRTHQIRLHLSHIGHPIVGDELYGNDFKSSKLLLHSYNLSFVHPITQERVSFEKYNDDIL